jgi:hypothetical protein
VYVPSNDPAVILALTLPDPQSSQLVWSVTPENVTVNVSGVMSEHAGQQCDPGDTLAVPPVPAANIVSPVENHPL